MGISDAIFNICNFSQKLTENTTFLVMYTHHFFIPADDLSADIMASLCRVRVNNFSDETARPRGVLFF